MAGSDAVMAAVSVSKHPQHPELPSHAVCVCFGPFILSVVWVGNSTGNEYIPWNAGSFGQLFRSPFKGWSVSDEWRMALTSMLVTLWNAVIWILVADSH